MRQSFSTPAVTDAAPVEVAKTAPLEAVTPKEETIQTAAVVNAPPVEVATATPVAPPQPALPQTASDLPLIGLAGLLSLGAVSAFLPSQNPRPSRITGESIAHMVHITNGCGRRYASIASFNYPIACLNSWSICFTSHRGTGRMTERRNNTVISRCLLALIGLAIAPFVSGAQASAPPQRGADEEYTLKLNANMVLLSATVVDRRNSLVSGLGKENFQIYEDGALQQIKDFTHQDIPSQPASWSTTAEAWVQSVLT